LSRGVILISGLYFTTEQVSAYGIVAQIFAFIGVFSSSVTTAQYPLFTGFVSVGNLLKARSVLIRGYMVFVVSFFLCTILTHFIALPYFAIFTKKVGFVNLGLFISGSIFYFFETHLTILSSAIVSFNRVPFVSFFIISTVTVFLAMTFYLEVFTPRVEVLFILPIIVQSFNYVWCVKYLKTLL
jgi:hypothetical protein